MTNLSLAQFKLITYSIRLIITNANANTNEQITGKFGKASFSQGRLQSLNAGNITDFSKGSVISVLDKRVFFEKLHNYLIIHWTTLKKKKRIN